MFEEEKVLIKSNLLNLHHAEGVGDESMLIMDGRIPVI